MICCKSYQDIPDDPRDNIMDSEDYFDLFLTEYYKRNGIKDLSDDNYETVRRWWYEFVCGRGEEWEYNCDTTLEEMVAELKEYDENREKHTCETCERKRDDVFCLRCRTGCNDDYTLSDYWHSYTRIEKSFWKRITQLQNDKGNLVDEVKSLKAQIEKMKCCQNCKNEGDYKEPYRYGTGWCNICKRHKVAKGNFDKWEIKEK